MTLSLNKSRLVSEIFIAENRKGLIRGAVQPGIVERATSNSGFVEGSSIHSNIPTQVSPDESTQAMMQTLRQLGSSLGVPPMSAEDMWETFPQDMYSSKFWPKPFLMHLSAPALAAADPIWTYTKAPLPNVPASKHTTTLSRTLALKVMLMEEPLDFFRNWRPQSVIDVEIPTTPIPKVSMGVTAVEPNHVTSIYNESGARSAVHFSPALFFKYLLKAVRKYSKDIFPENPHPYQFKRQCFSFPSDKAH